jgi:mRNA interferase RelE/StbE
VSSPYRVVFTQQAEDMLADISDRRVQQAIRDKARALVNSPAQQGKPLVDELAGHRSVRAVGQRYRIVYRVGHDTVIVIAVGLRREGDKRDIYRLAKKRAAAKRRE